MPVEPLTALVYTEHTRNKIKYLRRLITQTLPGVRILTLDEKKNKKNRSGW